MRKSQICAFLAAILAAPPLLHADFSYQESTQVTGGSMLSMIKMAGAFSSQAQKATDPIVSSVYLKGNRMARVSPQSIEIIDLDQQTITQIDTVKHTYTVMTFAQMKAQLVQAESEMAKKQAEAPAAPAASPAAPASDVKLSFDVHVRQTGVAKEVNGLQSTESILTMMMNATNAQTAQSGTMAVTNDMWLVPEIPGYAEMGDFFVRMGQQMGPAASSGAFDMSRVLNSQPGANQAMTSLVEEMRKIQGVPVLQVMRIGMTTNGQPLPAASEAPLPPSSAPPTPSAGDVAKQGASSAISSRLGSLGGFGGFGHKEPAAPPPTPAADSQTPPPTPAADSQTPPPTSVVLIESQTQSSNFSSAPVAEAHFEVPAGYKQVQGVDSRTPR
jgi:hypothetical protein